MNAFEGKYSEILFWATLFSLLFVLPQVLAGIDTSQHGYPLLSTQDTTLGQGLYGLGT